MFGLHGKTHFDRQMNFMYNHTGDFNVYNSSIYHLNVETGSIVLWPSDIEHGSNPNPSDELRIALCFNSFVRGKLGFGNMYVADLEIK
jgi:ectoine hydroxylase-related dioxygenase (phytanoyl-CoA dioxygenase family)